MSPSAASICIICHSDIAGSSNKQKLWKGNEKNKICSELGLYFGDTITRNRDFQCVCQACYRKIKTQLKAKQEKEASFHEGRKLAEEQFIRSRSKRSILLTTPPPKKQLLYWKSDTNQPRTKLPTTVKIAVSSHNFCLFIYNKSNIILSLFWSLCIYITIHYSQWTFFYLAKITMFAMLI